MRVLGYFLAIFLLVGYANGSATPFAAIMQTHKQQLKAVLASSGQTRKLLSSANSGGVVVVGPSDGSSDGSSDGPSDDVSSGEDSEEDDFDIDALTADCKTHVIAVKTGQSDCFFSWEFMDKNFGDDKPANATVFNAVFDQYCGGACATYNADVARGLRANCAEDIASNNQNLGSLANHAATYQDTMCMRGDTEKYCQWQIAVNPMTDEDDEFTIAGLEAVCSNDGCTGAFFRAAHEMGCAFGDDSDDMDCQGDPLRMLCHRDPEDGELCYVKLIEAGLGDDEDEHDMDGDDSEGEGGTTIGVGGDSEDGSEGEVVVATPTGETTIRTLASSEDDDMNTTFSSIHPETICSHCFQYFTRIHGESEGEDNSLQFMKFCAKNDRGTRCLSVMQDWFKDSMLDFTVNTCMSHEAGTNCASNCTSYIDQSLNTLGCCAPFAMELFGMQNETMSDFGDAMDRCHTVRMPTLCSLPDFGLNGRFEIKNVNTSAGDVANDVTFNEAVVADIAATLGVDPEDVSVTITTAPDGTVSVSFTVVGMESSGAATQAAEDMSGGVDLSNVLSTIAGAAAEVDTDSIVSEAQTGTSPAAAVTPVMAGLAAFAALALF